ncbi:2-polyprenylphenol hydroxylase [Candidatus Tisiphia endosymbiont of Beris chalybata]|uniref:2-polyprenylphenol hydroxylase n=1 Tax=Candidatus Tisiphia endosymbiont of Beris chalybata TaxID=3066262 RepID=UPI00312C6FCE
MNLAFGLDFIELQTLEGLKKLDQIFQKFLQDHNYDLYKKLSFFRNNADKINPNYYSEFLLEISPILDDFLAQLFGIESEVAKLRFTHKEFDIIYECKRKFVHRTALKKYPYEKLKELNFNKLLSSIEQFLGVGFTEDKFAQQVLAWQLNEELYSVELNEAAKYAACMVYSNPNSILFSRPSKIDQNNLIDDNKVESYKQRVRVGFDFFDPEFNLNRALNGANYCIYCHKTGKDSCSKGLFLPGVTNKENPLVAEDAIAPAFVLANQQPLKNGNALKLGCPLKQKISEMNYVKAKGFNLAALAIIIIDNPMVAATGHRICNDCANSCIYQKQEPVDIPLIESNILQETLLLPYGVEIYLLLTNWNPLNILSPLPAASTNYKILVAGLGPAGFSLCYYLLREGHNVVAVDGFKINPLPFDIVNSGEFGARSDGATPIYNRQALSDDVTNFSSIDYSSKPIKYWLDYKKKLSERAPAGFGGVAEYGITPRWDKNNLTILQLILQRNSHFLLFSGVSLGSNITIEQVIELGFDHLAICTGADTPKVVKMKNFLAKGVRTASDVLMTIQSGGAFLEESITNLLIRMPIIVIGGGLTAVDVAVESLFYYRAQVIKFYKKYQALIKQNGTNYTERDWTKEDRLIAEEFITHAKLFQVAQDKEAVLNILNELGGATIFYRGKLKDSPAYKLNPDEVMYAMATGIKFVANMDPVTINVDEYEYTESVEFNNLGIKKKVLARTVIMAVGTENHRDFLKNNYSKQGSTNNFLPEKITPFITYFGDCNPLFAGSVVKAIASSKEGYKFISQNLLKNKPNFSGNYLNFFAKLDYLLISYIQEVNVLAPEIIELVVHSPLASQNFRPGQFFRLQNYAKDIAKIMEPLALTGAYARPEKGLINLIIQEKGGTSRLCRTLSRNEQIVLMGPCGNPTEILKDSTLVLIATGIGNALLIPVAQALKNNNCTIIYLAGYKKLQDRFYQEKIENSADIVIWCGEEEILPKNRVRDISIKGNVIDGIIYSSKLQELKESIVHVNRIIAASSPKMTKAIKDIKDEIFSYDIPMIVSLNSPMQCMMKGICGQCIQKVTNKQQYIFVCACQEQEAKIVDFEGLKNRLEQNSLQEKL